MAIEARLGCPVPTPTMTRISKLLIVGFLNQWIRYLLRWSPSGAGLESVADLFLRATVISDDILVIGQCLSVQSSEGHVISKRTKYL